VATLKAEHAAKEKLRKDRKEEQQRNVERKKGVGAEGDHTTNQSVEENDGGIEDDEMWDEDEEITDGEQESSGDEELSRPTKKVRMQDR